MSESTPTTLLAVQLFFGLVAAWIGKSKGRSILGFFLGFFVGLFGWLIMFILRPKHAKPAKNPFLPNNKAIR